MHFLYARKFDSSRVKSAIVFVVGKNHGGTFGNYWKGGVDKVW